MREETQGASWSGHVKSKQSSSGVVVSGNYGEEERVCDRLEIRAKDVAGFYWFN